jgi:hypothetical protein
MAINSTTSEAVYALTPRDVDPRIQRAFHRLYSGSLRGRWLREVLALWPRLAGWLGR